MAELKNIEVLLQKIFHIVLYVRSLVKRMFLKILRYMTIKQELER